MIVALTVSLTLRLLSPIDVTAMAGTAAVDVVIAALLFAAPVS